MALSSDRRNYIQVSHRLTAFRSLVMVKRVPIGPKADITGLERMVGWGAALVFLFHIERANEAGNHDRKVELTGNDL